MTACFWAASFVCCWTHKRQCLLSFCDWLLIELDFGGPWLFLTIHSFFPRNHIVCCSLAFCRLKLDDSRLSNKQAPPSSPGSHVHRSNSSYRRGRHYTRKFSVQPKLFRRASSECHKWSVTATWNPIAEVFADVSLGHQALRSWVRLGHQIFRQIGCHMYVIEMRGGFYPLADHGIVWQWSPLGWEDRFECESLHTKSAVDRYIQLLHAQRSLSVYQLFELL